MLLVRAALAGLLASTCAGLRAPGRSRAVLTVPRAPATLRATPEANTDADFARMQAEIDAIMDATAIMPAVSAPASAPAPSDAPPSPLGKRLIAALSSLTAALAFFVQHNSADVSGVALMRRMEAESAPLAALACTDRPTLVEFFAPWCESCRDMAPTMRALELKYRDRVNFVAIDGSSAANEQLVSLFRVDGIPHTALLTRDREVVTALVGAVPRAVMEEDITALLAASSLPHVGFDAFAAAEGGGYPLGRQCAARAQAAGPAGAAQEGQGQGLPGGASAGVGSNFGASSGDLEAAARAALGPR